MPTFGLGIADEKVTDDEQSLFTLLKEKTMMIWDKVGEVAPLFVICLPTKELVLVPCNFSNTEEKMLSVRLVRLLAKSFEAIMVGTVAEAYVAKPRKDSAIIPASLDPDRKEAVQITVMGKEKVCSGFSLINRLIPGDESTPGTLSDWEEDTDQETGGYFFEQLSPNTFHKEDTELDKTVLDKLKELWGKLKASLKGETHTNPEEFITSLVAEMKAQLENRKKLEEPLRKEQEELKEKLLKLQKESPFAFMQTPRNGPLN